MTGTPETSIGLWLRRQREARGLARREMARRLIQAGRDAGDMSVPGVESMAQYIRRWETRGTSLTERYKLYFCEVFGITAADFGLQDPDAGHLATINANGLSVSLSYISGRIVIDISGMQTCVPEPEPGTGPGRTLALVPTPAQPRSYGGRA
jgi:transcriptional regulator with XRE-family HTH domain